MKKVGENVEISEFGVTFTLDPDQVKSLQAWLEKHA